MFHAISPPSSDSRQAVPVVLAQQQVLVNVFFATEKVQSLRDFRIKQLPHAGEHRNSASWSVAGPLALMAPGEGWNPRFGGQTGPADLENLFARLRLLWGHWCGAIMCRGEPDRVVIC